MAMGTQLEECGLGPVAGGREPVRAQPHPGEERDQRQVLVDPRVEQVPGTADDEVAQLVEHEVELTPPEPQRGVWNGSLRLKTASRSLANAWSRPEGAPHARWRGYLGALALVAAATGVAALMQRRFDLSNLIMVYLVGGGLSA